MPRVVRGFQIRIDLIGAKPPVWRRILVRGDLRLPEFHAVIQAVMGWENYHLHRFRTSNSRHAAGFITAFDKAEGDDGVLEDNIRVDQIFGSVGDHLWYDYDFGDGWEHVLKLEKVLTSPPARVEVLAGRRACPPEDCGGISGYTGLATWVESGYRAELLPENFDDTRHALDWLPSNWHPNSFDLGLAQRAAHGTLDNPT